MSILSWLFKRKPKHDPWCASYVKEILRDRDVSFMAKLFVKETPYELAMEQNHTEVANMIADYRENGPSILAKYEKRTRDQPSGEQVRCVWQSITLLLLYNIAFMSVCCSIVYVFSGC